MHLGSFRTAVLGLTGLLLLLLLLTGRQVASNGDFSYFYGTIAPSDRLCAKKVVGIGTKTPVQVDYSSTVSGGGPPKTPNPLIIVIMSVRA